MIDHLQRLIEALRDELKQYGEILALWDQQQELAADRILDEVFNAVSAVHLQTTISQSARQHRENCQADLAIMLKLPSNASVVQLLAQMPPDYRPLFQALVQENNELLFRIQQRAQQNHGRLSRSLDLMQQSMKALLPGVCPTLLSNAESGSNRAAPLHHCGTAD
jgi:hypothetical protein